MAAQVVLGGGVQVVLCMPVCQHCCSSTAFAKHITNRLLIALRVLLLLLPPGVIALQWPQQQCRRPAMVAH
jgi:hypothetical protein